MGPARSETFPVSRLLQRCSPRANLHVLEDALLNKVSRATRYDLLGRLEDQSHLAVHLITELGEDLGQAKQHRGMPVVSARVHPTRVLRREVEIVLFLNGERVNVRSNSDDRPGPRARDVSNDAGLQRAIVRHVPGIEEVGNERRRLMLLEADLRVRMKVPAPADYLL